MKNNTKLIMETWRRFLNESPGDVEDPRTYDPYDGMPAGDRVNPAEDPELVDDFERNSDPFHDEYNPQGVGEDGYHDNDIDDGIHGGPTEEDRVESVYRRLMLDPKDPLHGFTDEEIEKGLQMYEERPEDPDIEAYGDSYPGYTGEDGGPDDFMSSFPTGYGD